MIQALAIVLTGSLSAGYLAGPTAHGALSRWTGGGTAETCVKGACLHLGLRGSRFSFEHREDPIAFRASASGASMVGGVSLPVLRSGRWSGDAFAEVEFGLGRETLALDELTFGRADFTSLGREWVRFEASWNRAAIGLTVQARVRPWLLARLAFGYEQYQFTLEGTLTDEVTYLLLTLHVRPEPLQHPAMTLRAALFRPGIVLAWQGLALMVDVSVLPTPDGVAYGGGLRVERRF